MALANSAPTAVRLSPFTAATNASAAVAENAAGAVLGTLSTLDPDAGDAFTYAVSDSRFEVAGSTLKLKAGVSLNYEAARFINLTITAFDQAGHSRAQSFGLAVRDVNEAPTAIRLSGGTVTENAAGAAIGTLTVVDPDAGDSHRFSVSDSRFEVVGGTLKLKAGIALDHEAAATVGLTVTATDAGGLSRAQGFTIRVGDVAEPPGGNSAPTGTVTIAGTAQQGQTLTAADTLADADGMGTVSYQWLADGVAIAGASGTSLVLGQAQVGKAITVQASYTDAYGTAEAVTSAATAAVIDVNDPATITGDTAGAVAEDGAVQSTSGTLFVSDPDAGEAVFAAPGALAGTYGSFSFDEATGAWDYTLDSSLPAVQALTAADQVTDTLTVTSLDGSASTTVTVTIAGADDAAVITGDTAGSVVEDGAVQSVSGTLFVSDPDAGEAGFAMPASLAGWFGTFSFDPVTGAWSYTLDNSRPAVQALTALRHRHWQCPPGARLGRTMCKMHRVASLDPRCGQGPTRPGR